MKISRISNLMLVFLFVTQFVSAADGISYQTTFVLAQGQVPASIKQYAPGRVYVLYSGSIIRSASEKMLKEDTILSWSAFLKSYAESVKGYRLIFLSKEKVDSVWQFDKQNQLTDKAFTFGEGMLDIRAFDEQGVQVDQFIFNYQAKFNALTLKVSGLNTRGNKLSGIETPDLDKLLRQYEVYNSHDRNYYAVSKAWILAVGIDDYGEIKFRSSKADAISFTEYFKKQQEKQLALSDAGSLFESFLFLDSSATKENILNALSEIKRRSSFNDYFIFVFSGCSNVIKSDPDFSGTQFFPYDVVVNNFNLDSAELSNRSKTDKSPPYKNCISLKLLQEYIQQIPANNQLFISEAGPSGKFRAEFIQTLMMNSREVANILNKNRVIIVPNGWGMDGVRCGENSFRKGPLNHYITSLDHVNIYNLFRDDHDAGRVVFEMKKFADACDQSAPLTFGGISYFEGGIGYFDVFFERKFLNDYNELLNNSSSGTTRGIGVKRTELKKKANLDGKSYALVVGTSNYKGKGWDRLPNAISDAKAVADELEQGYGFDVRRLEDRPMDSIYNAIRDYYQMLQPNDQLLIYFAGHGDMETEFMDDGFIVCADSKAREDDPIRNSYIPYSKLQLMLNRIPARQVMVMLDVCHGGVFNQNRKRNTAAQAITNRNVLQYLADQAEYKCRKFLSSVGTEPAFDGKPGDHSPFANLLLQVLRARGRNTNGIVTLSQIFYVLQTASMNESAKLKITPEKDGFGDDNPESDFILIPFQQEIEKN